MFRRDAFGRFDPDDFVTAIGTPSRRLLLKGLAASGLLLAGGRLRRSDSGPTRSSRPIRFRSG